MSNPAWRAKARSIWFRWWRRAHNRLLDAWARLNGACNASTWDPIRKRHNGGYSHWRCGKAAGHAGPHRFNNYTWWYLGETTYDPIPVAGIKEYEQARVEAGLTHLRVTRFRHTVMSRGRQRAHDREMAMLGKLRRNEIFQRRTQKRLR